MWRTFEKGQPEEKNPGAFRVFAPAPDRVKRSAKDWMDVIVPSDELEDPYYDYSQVFSIFDKGRRTRGAAPMPTPREGGEEPRGQGARPVRNQPPIVDPANWFDLNRIWAAVQTVRADSRFTPGKPVAVVKIGNAARSEAERAQDLIRFFRIPPEEVRRFSASALWSELLNPFLDELAYSLNYVKPREFPGKMRFQAGNDGSYWLGYLE
jgi:hypothetical protein